MVGIWDELNMQVGILQAQSYNPSPLDITCLTTLAVVVLNFPQGMNLFRRDMSNTILFFGDTFLVLGKET